MGKNPRRPQRDDINVLVAALLNRIEQPPFDALGALDAAISETIVMARRSCPDDDRVRTIFTMAESFVLLGQSAAALSAFRNALICRVDTAF